MNEAKLATAYRDLGHVPHALVHDVMHGQFDRVRSDLSTGRATAGNVADVHAKLTELELIPEELVAPTAAFLQQIKP